MKQAHNPWWDDVNTTDKIETRDDILLAAMTDARKEITSLMARDTDQWQWGSLHAVGWQPDSGKQRNQPDRESVRSWRVSGWRWSGGGQCHGV